MIAKYTMKNTLSTLATVHSFEEYEQFKQQTFILENIAKEIINRHHLPTTPLTLFSEGTNIVFLHNDSNVIKIFPPFHQDQFNSEQLVLKHLEAKLSIKTPCIQHIGDIAGWPYIIMTKLNGTLLETLWENLDHSNKKIIIRELGALIKEVHAIPTNGLEEIDCHWETFISKQIANCANQHRSRRLAESLVQQIPDYLAPIEQSLRIIRKPVLLTGEYTPMNFMVKKIADVWHIDGLFDFGDAMLGLPEYDLLGPGAFLIQGDSSLLREFLTAYGYSAGQMNQSLSQKLTALMLLHKYSHLKVQIRINEWENKVKNIQDLEKLVWGL
jgi:hygromycin-B 7''-O-kinase